MSPPLDALLVSYAFPPVGGAGVQRTVKLAKYLPEHGVTPTVLTVQNASAPLTDTSFARDLSPAMVVHRAPTLEPGYAAKQAAWTATAHPAAGPTWTWKRRAVQLLKAGLQPDPQVLWIPGAARALAPILRGPPRIDAVLVSAPPFSQYLLGPWVRRHRDVALVLDYRDEWTMARTTYEMLAGRVATRVGSALEAWLLRYADAVTTATEEFRTGLLDRFPGLDPGRVRAIPNGYDPDDFPQPLPEPPADRFVVAYAGTVFKLTSARGLLQAVRRLHERDPELARWLRVRCIGRVVDTELPFFEGTERLGVERVGYVPHDQVLGELARSHLVLCLLDDVPGVERIYPAKVFELMHLGRPVLTLAPEGALTRLVRRHGLGSVFPPRDVDAIAEHLARLLRAFRDRPDAAPTADPPVETERYHRRVLAGEFAEVLGEALARRRAAAR
jgi:glycosyltransferase involved in cell wall biosynthesis